MDDRYEIREKIGQGGIGRVFRAYDRIMNREVAIKRILTSMEDPSLEGEATKQLMAEVAALASLQHPHIITVFDVGRDEEGPYVIMELLNGKNLDEIIEDGPMSWEDFRQVAVQSQEALVAAQELNMVHSDLKPPNIMITWLASGNIQVKVVDFGLAVLVHNQSQEEIEKMDSVFGSIFFMPPEQFERKVLDARSDLYSIGCVYYQALTGTYPFNGTTGNEVMDAHLTHDVTPLEQLRGDIPTWAAEWVMWLINRDPADRPQSAHDALTNFHQNDMTSTSLARPIETPAVQPASALSVAGVVGAETTSQVPQMTSTSLQGNSGSGKSLVNKRNIFLASAALVLISFLVVAVTKRNERIRRGWAYNNVLTLAEEKGVMAIPMNAETLDTVLEKVSQSAVNHDISIPLKALAVAISTDGTDVDTVIANFTTEVEMPDEIRDQLFDSVIEERGSSVSIPIIKAYVEKTGKGRDTLERLVRENGMESPFSRKLERKPVEKNPETKPEPSIERKPQSNPSRPSDAPKSFEEAIATLESGDNAAKIEAIRELGEAESAEVHVILLRVLQKERNRDVRMAAVKQFITFNSKPERVNGEKDARSFWRQIKWATEDFEERKVIILALKEMNYEWVDEVLEDYAKDRKSAEGAAFARQVLEERQR